MQLVANAIVTCRPPDVTEEYVQDVESVVSGEGSTARRLRYLCGQSGTSSQTITQTATTQDVKVDPGYRGSSIA